MSTTVKNIKSNNLILFSIVLMFSNHGCTQNNFWHFSGLPGENNTALVIDTYNASVKFAINFNGINRNNSISQNIIIDKGNYTTQEFKLYLHYPNIFNSIPTIEYDFKIPIIIQLSISKLLEQKIIDLVSARQTSSHYKIIWDGTDAFGNPFSISIYIYELIAVDQRLAKKMFLFK